MELNYVTVILRIDHDKKQFSRQLFQDMALCLYRHWLLVLLVILNV